MSDPDDEHSLQLDDSSAYYSKLTRLHADLGSVPFDKLQPRLNKAYTKVMDMKGPVWTSTYLDEISESVSIAKRPKFRKHKPVTNIYQHGYSIVSGTTPKES
ncbi:unnamed protein product [Protopolystoma xenopodis]|uniref:Uncharacterized protein n=1 Tax=Protopolystoma xenopodis TaxID=117903 RepID=A0A3S4ZW15_9PLAT|nr:unnamed protein product [Protopolystoma xenopodis]